MGNKCINTLHKTYKKFNSEESYIKNPIKKIMKVTKTLLFLYEEIAL